MCTFLIVEDDWSIRTLMRELLVEEGHTVFITHTYEEAITYMHFHSERLLVFLDMGKAGQQILLILAADPSLMRRHQVMAFTGQCDQYMPALVKELNLPILHKPFALEEFEAVVADFEQVTVHA